MSLTVVALGDSFSCGEGVGIEIRPEQTWAALLCDALPGARLVNLSTPGARLRDVSRDQLPATLAAAPALATIMVGLNDIIRSGLSGDQLTADMRAMVGELASGGAAVLIARWHDPGAVLGIPTRMRRALGERLAMVNDAVDAAVTGVCEPAGWPRVMTLDLGRIPELTEPGAWAVDGVHPSLAGHRAIARCALAVLSRGGSVAPYLPGSCEPLAMPAGPSAMRRTAWLLSCGLPWLAQHSGRVAPAVASMALQVIRDRGQSEDPSAAQEIRAVRAPIGVRLGAPVEVSAQPLPGRGVTGLGQRRSTAEIAWTAG